MINTSCLQSLYWLLSFPATSGAQLQLMATHLLLVCVCLMPR